MDEFKEIIERHKKEIFSHFSPALERRKAASNFGAAIVTDSALTDVIINIIRSFSNRGEEVLAIIDYLHKLAHE